MVRRNILISGASAGLGMGMARRFAAMGRNLALCARRADRLEELRAELTAAQPRITVVVRQLDVTDHDDVFAAFGELRDKLGGLDRIIVNAGRSKGKPVGTGSFEANRQILETNLVAALAQAEAAMEIFREQRAGHLVMISSIAAVRGFPGGLAAYAASKAGVGVLAESLRIEMRRLPVAVSTIFPGYIRSEMNAHRGDAPFVVDTDEGCRLLVRAIEREPAQAAVPSWPWAPLGFALRHLPLGLTARLMTRFT
jgi:NADP-dependent 3-hydroxy acid dehydrogenase YdfG